MLTKEAIEALSKADAIRAADEAAVIAVATVALPNDFTLHDVEKYMDLRRRLRGAMTTSALADFASYAIENKENGARVFVSQSDMSATAVLNIGKPDAPGHADNTATLKAQSTAAYRALVSIANGQGCPQAKVAEFLEDWAPLIQCERDGQPVPLSRAIAAVRAISIEKLQKVGAEEQQLSATRTAFESVKAEGSDIPAFINFKTEPFQGLASRVFSMRLGIITEGKPAITLRIVKAEQHAEEMATELANLVRTAIGDAMPVLVGSYSVKA